VLCVFSVQLLISCRLYTDCCAHVLLCVFSVQLLISCSLYTNSCAHVVLCVFSVQLLISCRLYTNCCAHVAGNPWHCDCDSMYTAYRTFREGTGHNLTLRCESPKDVKGESWDVLEERCKPTVTPSQPAVTRSTANNTAVNTANNSAVSTANTTAVSTSQHVQFNITVQHNVSVKESSPDPWHSSSPFLVIFVACFAAAVFIAVVVIMIIIRRLRSPRLNHLWWEDVVSRQELMSK